MKTGQVILLIIVLIVVVVIIIAAIPKKQPRVPTVTAPTYKPTANVWSVIAGLVDVLKTKKKKEEEPDIKAEDISGQFINSEGYLVDAQGGYVNEDGDSVEIPVQFTQIA